MQEGFNCVGPPANSVNLNELRKLLQSQLAHYPTSPTHQTQRELKALNQELVDRIQMKDERIAVLERQLADTVNNWIDAASRARRDISRLKARLQIFDFDDDNSNM